MAIDTEDKRRSVIHILPDPDGEALTEADRKQVVWIYSGLPFVRPEILAVDNRDLSLTLSPERDLTLTLSERALALTIPNRGSIMVSKRQILQSPEIGIEETAPYTLTVPASWGTATNPSAEAKDSDGDTVAGVVSGVSVASNVISFTVDGTALIVNNDYRIEIKFDVSGGTLEAWGVWSARL